MLWLKHMSKTQLKRLFYLVGEIHNLVSHRASYSTQHGNRNKLLIFHLASYKSGTDQYLYLIYNNGKSE